LIAQTESESLRMARGERRQADRLARLKHEAQESAP
jgi:hypothetical protein